MGRAPPPYPNLKVLILEVKDIKHHKRPAVHEDDVSAHDQTSTFRWRRRQTPFKVLRAGSNMLSQPWRQSPTHHELPFQSGRQLVALGEPVRKMVPVFVVPAMHLIAVVV